MPRYWLVLDRAWGGNARDTEREYYGDYCMAAAASLAVALRIIIVDFLNVFLIFTPL